jgi:hypothetical protein
MLSLGTLYPIGAVVQGAVADHHGVRVVTVAGALVLLAVLTVIALARPQVFTSLSDPVGAPGPKPGSLTIEPPEEIPAV